MRSSAKGKRCFKHIIRNCFRNNFQNGFGPGVLAVLLPVVLSVLLPACSARISEPLESSNQKLLQKVLEADHRSEQEQIRDQYRHPLQTLAYFDVRPSHTVVEIWPGGGWYTKVLAPYLKDEGQYYGAGFAVSLQRTPRWREKMQSAYNQMLLADPKVYGNPIVTELAYPERVSIAPEGSVDRIVTFRNVHNWIRADQAKAMFEIFYRTLKPGGVLGVVQHRAATGTSLSQMKKTGYVTEDYVAELGTKVGFSLAGKAQINANVLDARDHPHGVWSLPPTFRTCKKIKAPEAKAQCFDKYRAIGESDRMTLRFVKPR